MFCVILKLDLGPKVILDLSREELRDRWSTLKKKDLVQQSTKRCLPPEERELKKTR